MPIWTPLHLFLSQHTHTHRHHRPHRFRPIYQPADSTSPCPKLSPVSTAALRVLHIPARSLSLSFGPGMGYAALTVPLLDCSARKSSNLASPSSHFTNGKTEAPRQVVTYPGTHRKLETVSLFFLYTPSAYTLGGTHISGTLGSPPLHRCPPCPSSADSRPPRANA